MPWWRAADEAAEQGWPAPVRDEIEVNATVPAVGPEQAAVLVRDAGCRTVKVKVAEPGQSLSDDLDRVAAVRDVLGPDGRIRVDANGAWDVPQASDALRRLAGYGLEYAEQPCRTVDELGSLRVALARAGVDVPVAADESIRRATDPYLVARRGAADIAVLKVQPLGGVRACLAIAAEIGLPVVVSSALETSVGIAAGVALAAALPELPYACGLNTVRLLTDDLVDDPLVAVDGRLPVRAAVPSPIGWPSTLPTRTRPRSGRLGWTRRGSGPRRTGRKGGTTVGDSSRCAQLVVTELLGAGVQEVVLSPGSRSAPLAYELFEADKIGLLRLHVRIDERTAGFLALGLAKASERPVAVVTTSGTAAANLHPAVLEAFHSHIPLVAMTADRPRAARHAGGNQTTDQAGLFARHVRAETQIDDAPSTPRSWRFELGRVLTAATGARSGTPGPVHLNLSFSEPLVPGVESAPIQPELLVTPRVTRPEPVHLPVGPQTLVVAGALSPSAGAAARAFAEQADLPLLAESVSNARGGPNALATGRLLLRTGLGEEIERVVMFGHPTLARPVLRLLGREDVELVVVASTAEWIDPGTNARLVTDAVALDPAGDGWRARWTEADGAMSARLAEVLDGLATSADRWSPAGSGRRWAARTPSSSAPPHPPGTSTWRRSAPRHPPCTPIAGWPGSTGRSPPRSGSGWWSSGRPTRWSATRRSCTTPPG